MCQRFACWSIQSPWRRQLTSVQISPYFHAVYPAPSLLRWSTFDDFPTPYPIFFRHENHALPVSPRPQDHHLQIAVIREGRLGSLGTHQHKSPIPADQGRARTPSTPPASPASSLRRTPSPSTPRLESRAHHSAAHQHGPLMGSAAHSKLIRRADGDGLDCLAGRRAETLEVGNVLDECALEGWDVSCTVLLKILGGAAGTYRGRRL